MAETPTWKRDILVLLAALGEEHGAHKELDLRVALRDDGGQRPLEEDVSVGRLVVSEPRGVQGHLKAQGSAPLKVLRGACVCGQVSQLVS